MEKYVEIRRWDNQEVIHSGYFISIKECLEDGVKRGISFYRADLRGVNLEGADLRGVNLEGADLTGVNFRGAGLYKANLSRANLREANLREANLLLANSTREDFEGVYLNRANLSRANLKEANLKDVHLWHCRGNNKEIKNIGIFGEYPVAYTKDILQIGCEGHSIEEWKGFSEEEILKMGGQEGLDFWNDNKYCIFNEIEEDPAL